MLLRQYLKIGNARKVQSVQELSVCRSIAELSK